MTILAPGSFKVSDFRKAISAPTEREVRKRYQLDHRPALTDRPYDTDAGDFIPPQNDPTFIELIEKAAHAERTFGRKAGAEKTVTTRGSDVGERARTRDIRRSEAEHQAAITGKGAVRPACPGKAYWRKKRELQSRWPKGRKMQSKGFERRQDR